MPGVAHEQAGAMKQCQCGICSTAQHSKFQEEQQYGVGNPLNRSATPTYIHMHQQTCSWLQCRQCEQLPGKFNMQPINKVGAAKRASFPVLLLRKAVLRWALLWGKLSMAFPVSKHTHK